MRFDKNKLSQKERDKEIKKLNKPHYKVLNSLYKEYSKAPEITKKRIYLETWAEVLKRFKNVQVIDENQKNVLPFLPLNGQNAQVKEEK